MDSELRSGRVDFSTWGLAEGPRGQAEAKEWQEQIAEELKESPPDVYLGSFYGEGDDPLSISVTLYALGADDSKGPLYQVSLRDIINEVLPGDVERRMARDSDGEGPDRYAKYRALAAGLRELATQIDGALP